MKVNNRDELDQLIDENFNEYLKALEELIAIESIQGEAEPEAPFGRGPKEALDVARFIASQWGFKTKAIDNAVGYAVWTNDVASEDYVGVLGHVDVVPAGSGWTYPPFELTILEERAFGRGVLDNKGPLLASLFALKLLKDQQKIYQKNVRVIFGTNEENGSADIPLYLAEERPPVYGFTPDSQFPAVYAEKGVVAFRIITLMETEDLMAVQSLIGNFISSSVPDEVAVLFSDGTVYQWRGKRAPSNEPQLGQNALTMAGEQLQHEERLSKRLRRYFAWMTDKLHDKHFGEGLNHAIAEMALQLTPYQLEIASGQLEFELSIRYGIDYQEEQVTDILRQNLPENSRLEVLRSFPPISFDLSDPMLEIMRQAYERVTGADGTPVITTGATYARFMPNIIAFGPSFPGQIGIAHNSDEYMDLADIKRNIKIYMLTLDAMLR